VHGRWQDVPRSIDRTTMAVSNVRQMRQGSADEGDGWASRTIGVWCAREPVTWIGRGLSHAPDTGKSLMAAASCASSLFAGCQWRCAAGAGKFPLRCRRYCHSFPIGERCMTRSRALGALTPDPQALL